MSSPYRVGIALGALTACAHDVSVVYPGPPAPAGAIDVVLNNPSRTMSITVNDVLVVDRKHSRKAHIEGVPAGIARVHIATGGRCEAGKVHDQEVEVNPGMTTTLALPGPEPNTGCMIFSGLYSIGMNIGLLTIAILVGGAAAEPHSHGKR